MEKTTMLVGIVAVLIRMSIHPTLSPMRYQDHGFAFSVCSRQSTTQHVNVPSKPVMGRAKEHHLVGIKAGGLAVEMGQPVQ